jgi:4-amino-4-deoxy-L-arabinose transferase-like glycosyltransferase
MMKTARWPLIVFALALLPRLIGLGTRPFWLDEVFTFQRASLSPLALIQDSFLNHHMPSFFLLVSPFLALGHPQFWLRLPAAFFGAVSVMLVFMIATRIAGRRAGLLGALVLGLSPTALAFSQEARSYTMEMALILVSLYGIVRLAQDVPAASAPLRSDAAARTGWLCFIGGAAAALDVLGDGLPWLITANVIGFFLQRHSPNKRALLRNFIVADAIIAALTAPFYIAMLFFQDKGIVDSVKWIPPLTLPRFWYDFGSVYMMRIADSVTFKFMDVSTPALVIELIDAGLLAAIFAAAFRLRRRPAMLATLLISFIFLPALFTIISIWRPILLPRYILWSAAPFAILAGIGASTLLDYVRAPRLRAGFMAAAAALLLVNMAPYYHAETKPRWDVAAKLLAAEVAPGDVVYLYDLGALPLLKLYLPPGTQMVVLNDSDGDLTHAEQAVASGKRVWAVYGHAGQSGSNNQWAQFYAKNQPLGTPSQIQVAGKRIFIALYDPTHLAMNCNLGAGFPPRSPINCS